MKRAGLIGKNISYSQSPQLHRDLAREDRLDLNYELFDCETIEEAKNFLQKTWNESDFVGFNVTQPYKISLATALGFPGPINTLYREPNKTFWSATSTDADGLFDVLKKTFSPFREVILLGNGGAAQVIAMKFRERNILLHQFNRSSDDVVLSFDSLTAALQKSDQNTLLIQATSAPLHGDRLESLAAPFREYFRGQLVEICYPKTSILFDIAKHKGLHACDGYPMLHQQAVLARKYWS